ncbi:MAG TPA: hypothetical protein VFJ11_01015 [Gaiellaceae bacterium]|nr:hypothetical protein [Gaiellaceae bacterium]
MSQAFEYRVHGLTITRESGSWVAAAGDAVHRSASLQDVLLAVFPSLPERERNQLVTRLENRELELRKHGDQ